MNYCCLVCGKKNVVLLNLNVKYKLSYKGYGPYGPTDWVEAPGMIGSTGRGQAMYGIAAKLEVR